jgi:hypothetical protein
MSQQFLSQKRHSPSISPALFPPFLDHRGKISERVAYERAGGSIHVLRDRWEHLSGAIVFIPRQ